MVNGIALYPECLERETVVCGCCQERVWRDETESDGRITICVDCYDRHYDRTMTGAMTAPASRITTATPLWYSTAKASVLLAWS